MTKPGSIYVGIGGWTYEPWRGVFYPKSLPHARELAYAGAHLTSIEVNGTFYRTQTPTTFRKWASEVPEGFVFSLKGPRYAVNRRVLKEAGDSIKRFLNSGVTELGTRLGPLLWQFTPYKKFDEADFGGFLELLPKNFNGQPLRHVVEVRHDSFKTAGFRGVAAAVRRCLSSSPSTRLIRPSQTSPAILSMRACRRATTNSRRAIHPRRSMAGPPAPQTWAQGGEPKDLPRVTKTPAKKRPRNVFVYFIHEAKVRAPAAAMALIERLK